MIRRALVVAVATALCVGPAVRTAHAADATQTAVWTASSYQDVFSDALPDNNSPHSVDLQAARNEYQAGQILVRKNTEFTISTITFSSLTDGTHTIGASNLHYNFVDYVHLNHNSVFGGNQPADLITRKAPGDFPDGLSNDTSRTVKANFTQPIWIKAYIPKGTAAGTYTGTVTVQTDHGNSAVPIDLTVYDATIPDAQQSEFTTDLWSLTVGSLSWDEGAGDTIELYYGYKRYSTKWWQLMASFAADMKQYRNNNLTLNLVTLLLDGGSSVDANGKYTFNWSRLDQYADFFIKHGAVKQIEGFWMNGLAFGRAKWQTETIGRDDKGKPIRQYVDFDSPQAKNFIAQFIPALKKHVADRGWAGKWWMHVSDEPTGSTAIDNWETLAGEIRAQWSDVRLADAIYDQPSAESLAPHENFLIANEFAVDPNSAYYDNQVAAGKQVWLYNCNIPVGMSLNRFIDEPVYDQRLTMWYAYEHGITGYLHWAFNNWQYKIDDEDVKGDGYIVLPDKKHNTLESTIRYESLRDGLQDRELLSIVGKNNPALAQGIAHSLVTRATRYTRDTGYMQRIETLLLKAAAGQPLSTQEFNGTTVDLGAQYQIDAIQVTGAPKNVDIDVSYDGQKWTTAYSGDGTFAGLNAKARYVKISAGTGIAISGSKLQLPNLAGGMPYTISEKPSHPDNGNDATDGVLAGQWSDGRSFGYDLSSGETKTVAVTVDLGKPQQVADVKIHRYEDYEFRYSPDDVSISTSTDGTHFTPKGKLTHTNGADGIWYDFDFPQTAARYLRVTFDKTYASGADALFIDEIEAYGSATPNDTDVALGKTYTKSANPDDPMFADVGNTESTDGIISGDFTDRHSYAYYVGQNQTRTISITIDLGAPIAVDLVRFRKYDDGDHNYSPDKVAVYTKGSTGDFVSRGTTNWATGQWFDVGFDRSLVNYVRIDITKTDAPMADYMFVDEVAVMGDLSQSPVNLARGLHYTKSAGVDPSYPDNDYDSTDGFIAGAYPDHRSYGYDLQSGETKTIDIDFDLGATHALQLVKFWRYNDGVHHYQPDSVTVYTSTDGTTYTKQSTVTTPDDRWFSIPLSTSGRYVRIEATKTYGYFADYIFVDEIQIYGAR